MIDVITNSLSEAQSALANLLANKQALQSIQAGGQLLIDCVAADGHIYSCGNGGSMCDAMHLAEELSGRFRADRRALGALALSDPGHLTCVGNDLGYEEVFARGVEALGRPGDVLVAFTTSGTSPNVLRALAAARQRQMVSIAVTGHAGTAVERDASLTIVTPGGRWADRVQELHALVIHALIELVERLVDSQEEPSRRHGER